MSNRILCVDDDPQILRAYARHLGEQFELTTASCAAEALQLIAAGENYAVVVSDNCMPGMDGIQLLARVREASPDTVRMMLTGYADVQTTIDAVNEGNIFRFLSKPCPPETMARALSAALDQYRLVVAEQELLEETLKGSIRVLTEVLSLVNPLAFGRAQRVRRLVMAISDGLSVQKPWQLDIAAMLSQLGCVAVPETTLERACRGLELAADEAREFQRHAALAADLLRNIPRMDEVSEMVAYQDKGFDGSGFPVGHRRGAQIPLGARILKAAIDFDRCESVTSSPMEALNHLKRNAARYDPAVFAALQDVLRSRYGLETRDVSFDDLSDGMVLAQELATCDGSLLVAKGQEVTPSLRSRLRSFLRDGKLREPFIVYTHSSNRNEL